MFLHRSYCHCNWHCMKKQGFNPGTLKLCAFSNTSKSDLLQSQESMHLHQLPNTYLSIYLWPTWLKNSESQMQEKKKALLAKMGNLPHIPKQLPFLWGWEPGLQASVFLRPFQISVMLETVSFLIGIGYAIMERG